jgi:UDP-glucose 4-epimerase
LLENLKKWFNFKFEIIYFYNVYGPKQISTGSMATVIGIFEDQYKKKKPLTVVKPGTQSRRFTHVNDTVEVCYNAWKKIKMPITIVFQIKKVITIKEVAKMFNSKIKFLPKEKERDMLRPNKYEFIK